MQPSLWQPPHELSSNEQAIMKRIKRAKLFVFLLGESSDPASLYGSIGR